jgi:hypothetical protein
MMEPELLSPSELTQWQRGLEMAELIQTLLEAGCTEGEIWATLDERKRYEISTGGVGVN